MEEKELTRLNSEGGISLGKGRIRSWVKEEANKFGAFNDKERVTELGTRNVSCSIEDLIGRRICCFSGNGAIWTK